MKRKQTQIKQPALLNNIYSHSLEVFIGGLLFIWVILINLYHPSVDLCWSDRNRNNDSVYFSLTTRILFGTSVGSMILCFTQVAFWHPPSGRSRIFTVDNLFGIFSTLVWFLMTYTICLLGKEMLEDFNCSHTKNSISGHYTFHVYYFLTIPHIYLGVKTYKDAESNNNNNTNKNITKRVTKTNLSWFAKNRESIMIATFIIYTISTSLTLSRTLLYGYHSLRQVFYGTLLAVVSNYLSVLFRPTSMRYPVLSSSIISFVLAVLIYNQITSYGPIPLLLYEKAAYALAWVGMLWFAWQKHQLGSKKRN